MQLNTHNCIVHNSTSAANGASTLQFHFIFTTVEFKLDLSSQLVKQIRTLDIFITSKKHTGIVPLD